MDSRKLVYQTLEFENKTGRVPRHLWSLPWAAEAYPNELKKLEQDFPGDIAHCPSNHKPSPIAKGSAFAVGEFVDEWGCRFTNIQSGIIGEVREPIVTDEEWEDTTQVRIPVEKLDFSIEDANAFCRSTDRFVLAGCCPRIFEQMQFMRGTAELYIDLMTRPSGFIAFMDKMKTFYLELAEKWAKTEVDALFFMDDWGSQQSLLINPAIWNELYLPFYQDLIQIAHRNGKKIFMHSDGHILAAYPQLVEAGLDAINSQIFCMGIDNLAPFAGKITFWGELDRQNLLAHATIGEVHQAVEELYAKLWKDGGCIAQCEFGIGGKPENVRAMFDAWAGARARDLAK